MKKLSKLDESAWGEMRQRSSGKVIRKENLYHTVFDIDISVENYDYDFNKTIKKILDDYHKRSYEIELGIAHSKDRGFTPDEMVNVRKWLAPYDYLIYDGLYGTDLVARFTDYPELLEFWLDEPEISEKDYVTLCKTIASKLKEIGENFISVPYTKPDVYCIDDKMENNYKGDFSILLINENDTDTWLIDQDILDYSDWLKDFYYDIITEFPELKNEDFLYWTYNNSSHGANIVIPINFNNVLNAKKYIEFTKQWFSSNEITESAWGEMRKRSAGEQIRKEDKIITNIKDIKPVDVGVSVLWADKDLEINGDTFVYIDQVKGFEKDGWRLPSQKEADELLTKAGWSSNKDPHSWSRFYTIGITHIENAPKENTVYFDCEIGKDAEYFENDINSNTPDGCWEVFSFKQDGSFYPHSAYSIADIEKDKCRVRLVKDK